MTTPFQRLIQTQTLPKTEIAARTREIYETSLRESRYLGDGNFSSIHPGDIERMFDLYDVAFFNGDCRKMLGDSPLSFRLSKRMTQAGGKASRRDYQDSRGRVTRTEYEIAVATTLLFQTFSEDPSGASHRPVVMSGIECRDRLSALQRVMEYEITHLVEMVIWNKSSCSAPRFQSIANRFFAHTEHHHQLITPRERAFTKFGVKPGDQVTFRFDGRHYTGLLNRITKRATVLVEDEEGSPYSNGKRYRKYYVPVNLLKPANE